MVSEKEIERRNLSMSLGSLKVGLQNMEHERRNLNAMIKGHREAIIRTNNALEELKG